jgi:hypothetical protein
MIRMNEAKQHNYDPGFKVAQDVDFLLQVMLDGYYCILPEALYVYAEHGSVTPEKILSGHRFWRRTLMKHSHRFPVASRMEYGKSLLKSAAYKAAFALGLKRAIISSRSRKPAAEEVAEFNRARDAVYTVARKVFGDENLRLAAGGGGCAG